MSINIKIDSFLLVYSRKIIQITGSMKERRVVASEDNPPDYVLSSLLEMADPNVTESYFRAMVL